ncbi:hypothetical protein ACIP88_29695 [Streptomyces uncialis]|uniref:hypothetical protein n=1 Tax=Streptomyces uncialis TaxID=1048205 RepID=UPI003818B6B6
MKRKKVVLTAATAALLAGVLSISLHAVESGGEKRESAVRAEANSGTTVPSGEAAGKEKKAGPFAFSLPMEKYALSREESGILQDAETRLQEACVARFGAGSLPPRKTTGAPDGPTDSNRRYGLTDLAEATRDGYQVPGGDDRAAAKLPQPDATQTMLLVGRTADGKKAERHQGLRVPEGGCYGESRRKVRRDHGLHPGRETARTIDLDSYRQSLREPRVVESFASWSRCMKRSGYTYTSPLTVTDDKAFADGVADGRERAVAQADVRCKFEVDLPKTWFTVESAVQQKMIKKHLGQLESLAASRRSIVEAARTL